MSVGGVIVVPAADWNVTTAIWIMFPAVMGFGKTSVVLFTPGDVHHDLLRRPVGRCGR